MSIKLNREEIMAITPHRDPILLMDEVLDMVPGQSIEATFYVKPEMEIFKGHFPGNPVFPGVYTVESMAQTTGVMMMSLEKYKGKVPLFLGINKASFKNKVAPGDTIHHKIKLLSEREDKAIITAVAETYVGDTLVATGELAMALR